MTRRDRLWLFTLAGLTLAVASLSLVGGQNDVLLAIPALAFVLPLLVGRYVGEDQIARLAAAFVAARRRPAPALAAAPASRRTRRRLPRGGTLLACSLAVRPPPAHPRTTA